MGWADLSEQELKRRSKLPHQHYGSRERSGDHCIACIARYQFKRRRVRKNRLTRRAKK